MDNNTFLTTLYVMIDDFFLVDMVAGFNYLNGSYGTKPQLAYGYSVLTLSSIAILVGIIGGLVIQSRTGLAGVSRVIIARGCRINRCCDGNRWHNIPGCAGLP